MKARRVWTAAVTAVVVAAGVAVAAPATPTSRIVAAGRFSYEETWDRYASPMVGPFTFIGAFAAGAKYYASSHFRGSLTPLQGSETYPMQLTVPGGYVAGTCTAVDTTSVDPTAPELTLDCALRVRGVASHVVLVLDGIVVESTGDGIHDPVFEHVVGTFTAR